MLKPDALPALHAALAALADPVDGWLLFDFRGINPIMAAVVGDDTAPAGLAVNLHHAQVKRIGGVQPVVVAIPAIEGKALQRVEVPRVRPRRHDLDV